MKIVADIYACNANAWHLGLLPQPPSRLTSCLSSGLWPVHNNSFEKCVCNFCYFMAFPIPTSFQMTSNENTIRTATANVCWNYDLLEFSQLSQFSVWAKKPNWMSCLFQLTHRHHRHRHHYHHHRSLLTRTAYKILFHFLQLNSIFNCLVFNSCHKSRTAIVGVIVPEFEFKTGNWST